MGEVAWLCSFRIDGPLGCLGLPWVLLARVVITVWWTWVLVGFSFCSLRKLSVEERTPSLVPELPAVRNWTRHGKGSAERLWERGFLRIIHSVFLVSSYRPLLRSQCHKQTADMNQHHKAAPLSGQRRNPSCLSSTSQLRPVRATRRPPNPRHQLTEHQESQPAEPTGRPATASDRAGQTGAVIIAIQSQTFAQTGELDLLYYGAG